MYTIEQMYLENIEYGSYPRTTNIQLGRSMDMLLLGIWIMACSLGLAIMFILKQPLIGAVVIGIPSFIGMILKPAFALSLWMLVLPSGTAITLIERFTLNKMIGLAVGLSFLINMMVSRPSLKINKAALWFGIGYLGWAILALTAVSDYDLLTQVLSKFQLAMLLIVAYWILSTNTRQSFHWVLRSYLIGTLGTVMLAIVTGAAITASDTEGRLTATAGGAINANVLSALLAVAFITAMYLFLVDKRVLWRAGYLFALLCLTVMLFRSGSRGSIVGLAAALLVTFFGKQLITDFRFTLVAVLILSVFGGLGYYLVTHGKIDEEVASRLTDINYAKQSLAQRMEYNKVALRVGLRRPFGTGYNGWLSKTDSLKLPHNELMFSIGIYGLMGGILYILFVLSIFRLIWKIPAGPEKIFTKSMFAFMVLIGLKGNYLSQKYYWTFIAVILVCELFSRMQTQTDQQYDDEQPEQYEYDELYESCPHQESHL